MRKSNSRERKSNFSLDFPAFGPSIRVGPRSKVVLRCKGYAWAPVLWSFEKLREVGVFSYSVIVIIYEPLEGESRRLCFNNREH